jgi:hypothetical protein
LIILKKIIANQVQDSALMRTKNTSLEPSATILSFMRSLAADLQEERMGTHVIRASVRSANDVFVLEHVPDRNIYLKSFRNRDSSENELGILKEWATSRFLTHLGVKTPKITIVSPEDELMDQCKAVVDKKEARGIESGALLIDEIRGQNLVEIVSSEKVSSTFQEKHFLQLIRLAAIDVFVGNFDRLKYSDCDFPNYGNVMFETEDAVVGDLVAMDTNLYYYISCTDSFCTTEELDTSLHEDSESFESLIHDIPAMIESIIDALDTTLFVNVSKTSLKVSMEQAMREQFQLISTEAAEAIDHTIADLEGLHSKFNKTILELTKKLFLSLKEKTDKLGSII